MLFQPYYNYIQQYTWLVFVLFQHEYMCIAACNCNVIVDYLDTLIYLVNFSTRDPAVDARCENRMRLRLKAF